MTTEYHDEPDDESSSFWNKEAPPVSLSAVSRFRTWLLPATTATILLILIVAFGASNGSLSNRLWSLEKSVANVTLTLEDKKDAAAKDVHRLKFAVENNKDQLTAVSDALKELSALDSIRKTVASLKCSFERFINNGSVSAGCCPLNWDLYGTSCYLFSKDALSWQQAKEYCNRQEAHLVILHTDQDWDYVIDHAHGSFYWVGLTDERGSWEWVNNTPYVMNRRRWRPGQPDSWTNHGLGSGDEDCAHLHSDGRLNDLHCTTRLKYICQSHSQRT